MQGKSLAGQYTLKNSSLTALEKIRTQAAIEAANSLKTQTAVNQFQPNAMSIQHVGTRNAHLLLGVTRTRVKSVVAMGSNELTANDPSLQKTV